MKRRFLRHGEEDTVPTVPVVYWESTLVFVYGGSFAVAVVLAAGVAGVATVVVSCDCCRLWLLLIVQGLMCAEGLGFLFLPLRCPLALRFCLRVVASCLMVVMVLLPPYGVRVMINGHLCGVDVVSKCLRGRSLGVSSGFSFAGSGTPWFMSSSLSSVQQSFPHTMASCVRKGKGSGDCRQLACHTMLQRVHSVSVPPASKA
jgi:hypothetical protein